MSEPVEIDYSIDRPSDAWMHAVAGLLARCFQINDQLGWRFFSPINKELRHVGCASYGDWLTPRQKYGGVYYPPVDQPRLVEVSALTAIQTGLKRDHFDHASHQVIILEPNQVMELRDWQDKAIREVNKRLRELEPDDGQLMFSDDVTLAAATRRAEPIPDWNDLLMSPPLPSAKIAEKLGQPFTLTDRMLRHQKKKNPCCCVEIEDRRKGEQLYLYRIEDVLPAIKKWLEKRKKKESKTTA